MARLPDEVVERIKREISVERLAESCGVELKRHGADLVGLCPFHKRSRAIAGDYAEQESVELPGRVPPRWRRDRLGDALGRRELPPMRSSFYGRIWRSEQATGGPV